MNWWGSKCRLTCKPDCAARLHLTKLQTAAILCFQRKNCKQKPALRNCVQHTYLLNSEQVLIFQSQNGGNGLGCSIFADFHSLIDHSCSSHPPSRTTDLNLPLGIKRCVTRAPTSSNGTRGTSSSQPSLGPLGFSRRWRW